MHALVAALAVLAVGLDSASAALGLRKRAVTVYTEMLRGDTATTDRHTIYSTYNIMRTEAGVVVGTVFVQKTTSTSFYEGGPTQPRLRSLIFNFTGGAGLDETIPAGQVTVQGVATYPNDSMILAPGSLVSASVTGRTGGWYGATGQLVTLRLDGPTTSRQTFEIYYGKNKGTGKGKGF